MRRACGVFGVGIAGWLFGCGGNVLRDRDPGAAGAEQSDPGASGSAASATASGGSAGAIAANGGSSAGGASTTGAAGAAELGGEPGATCGPFIPQANAAAVSFVFHSNQTVWIRQECYPLYQLSYVCKDRVIPFVSNTVCAQSCNSTNGCSECGACIDPRGIPVGPGATQSVPWAGVAYDLGTTADGCSCADSHPAPAGTYQLDVSVYLTEQDASNEIHGYPHVINFQLPTKDGIVSVDLGFQGI